MKHRGLPAIGILLSAILLSACGQQAVPRDGLHGAWLGKGTFVAQQGSQEVTAQLEILPDGTYRLLMLEPPVLMMLGLEHGTWQRNGNVLDLAPEEGTETAAREEGFSLFQSAPRDFRPKSLFVADDEDRLVLDDGPMEILFTFNTQATRALREAGDL